MESIVSFAKQQHRPLTVVALAGLALVSVQRRAAAVMASNAAAAAGPRFTCSGDGTDCPCHSAEKRAPPAAPSTAGPVKITLAPGESKWLCSCGLSKNYPFCDGSHQGSARGLKPSELKNATDAAKDYYVCSCGHSKNPEGLCDGSHKKVVAKA